jgi:DNA repair exonuclease SbcCD ATPase subunit
VLEERISANKATESIKLSNKVTIESAAKGLAEERDTLHRKCAVLDNTAQMMGVKGVQHFIFMSLIKVLETIANLYLQALADGGVQLVLSEDEEGDKVVKGVTIRGADGEFRSRGLSQLSGGQWRLTKHGDTYVLYLIICFH